MLLFINPTNGSLVSSVPLVDPSDPSPFQVRHAVGLDVDDQGNIFVLTSDGRIQSYSLVGGHLQDELKTDIFTHSLDTTLGLAFTGDGFLIAGIFKDTIYRVDRSGSIVETLPVPGPFSEALDLRRRLKRISITSDRTSIALVMSVLLIIVGAAWWRYYH